MGKKVDKKLEGPIKTRPSRDKGVTLADGFVVTMRPLPLPELAEVMDSFFQVFALHAQGLNPLEIMRAAMGSVVTLLKKAIVFEGDLTLDAADAPFVMNAFLEQNMNEATQDQWRALIGRVGQMFPDVQGRIAEIQKQLTK